jgi:hypothetical protein
MHLSRNKNRGEHQFNRGSNVGTVSSSSDVQFVVFGFDLVADVIAFFSAISYAL